MIIPDVNKILYATDLSENARYCFGYAVSLAHQYDASLTILHVLEIRSGYMYDLSNYLGAEKWEELKKSHDEEAISTIQTRLADFCAEVAAEDDSCKFIVDDILVKRGNPVEEILHQAESGDFDLVVMGTHGHKALADVMMGSTARRILRRCKKPVLVVRLPEG
jgi:nucleotide-binding universal stress UspA family protein